MRLELPPERRLPNPEWMVGRILTERRATAGRRPAARRYWLSGLVAAAVVITAAAIGWAALVPTGRPRSAPRRGPALLQLDPQASGARLWAHRRSAPHPPRLRQDTRSPVRCGPPHWFQFQRGQPAPPLDRRAAPPNPRPAPTLLPQAPLRPRPKNEAPSRLSPRGCRSASAFKRRTWI